MQVANRHQHLVFDHNGIILKSCDTLFPTKASTSKKIGDFILFTRSIIPYINETLKHQSAITFKGIHAPAVMLPGSYDFVFSAKSNERDQFTPAIECWIIERTEFYKDIHKYWQNIREEALVD